MKNHTFYLDPELVKRLAVLAKQADRSLNNYLGLLIKEHINQKGEK